MPPPSIFIGHGSPTSFLDDPKYVKGLQAVASKLEKPKCILVVSAHWQTDGLFFTNNAQNPLIYDFYGFPQEMYEIEYPTSGYPDAANDLKEIFPDISGVKRGLDHGAWTALKPLFPKGDIAVVQLSIDANLSFQQHYELALKLDALKDKGYLIIGSGNITHNLRAISFDGDFTVSWAMDFHSQIIQAIKDKNLSLLLDPHSLGEVARLSLPSSEHYIPLIYSLGNLTKTNNVEFFNEYFMYGSLAMTGLIH
ncbi:MAG: class III extradiol ring-cleavage dioxygenase [bacterium]